MDNTQILQESPKNPDPITPPSNAETVTAPAAVTESASVAAAHASVDEPQQPTIESRQNPYAVSVRSVAMKLLLGCIVTAAALAVLLILIGEWNETTGKAVSTVLSAAVFVLIALGVVSVSTDTRSERMVRSSNMLINVSLVLIVLGFLTSVFNIWDVLDSEVTSKLYATYFVLLGTALYGKVLYDIEGELTNMQKVIWANYGMVALVAMLLLGLIYSSEASELLSGFYGRLLAASSITAATLSIVIAIQQHLFYQKHPELKQKRRHSAGKIILIVVLVIIFVPTLISMILSAALYSRY